MSVDPAHARDVERCAAVAAGLMKKAGATVKVARTRGFPVVLGAFRAGPRHPTVTIYNHLDVVPAGGADWSRPPFKMAIAGDRFYARGATDDKGPALTALFAARSARELRVPLNIRFLWECEEEIGSPSFEAFLCKTAKSIPTDSVLVSDTIWVARNKPAVSAGLRGLVGVLLALETGEKDCHSGLTGGAARNPLAELAQVVARCVDGRTGRVTIPGFYDGVLPLAREELASFRESGFSLAAFKKAHGLKKLRSGSALSAMKAIWGAPTFEVHGFSGGYQGPGVKTAVPPRGEAKVSMRLVPGQEPRKVLHLLKEHVRRLNPDVRVSGALSLEPFRGVTSGPFAQAAAEAMRFAFGKSPAVVREGGSIGAVVTMEKVLKCPVCLIGLSLPEHGYHGPNEFFDWRQASGGMLAFVKYFEQISRIR
ncbi:MAG: M20/M25/M40 family metallo-hydrolase [Planctomycetes bacterium]|nr:M20/M25/M40 family metallo-hydrolase [Planctomycetota bacterium]